MATNKDAGLSQIVSAVKAQRAAYLDRIGKLASALEKDFRSARFRPWRDGDDEIAAKDGKPPLFRLEDYCARFCRSRVEARALLAVSPHTEETDDNWNDVRFHARSAMALDLLMAARRAGFFKPGAAEV